MMAHDNGNSDGGYSDDGNYSDEYEDDFEALESPEKPIVFGQPRPWIGPTSSLDLGAVDFSPPSAGVGSRASTESASSVLQATRGSVGGGGGGASQQHFPHHPRHSSNTYAALPVAESSLNGTDTSAGTYHQTGPNMPVLPEPMQRLPPASRTSGKVESQQPAPVTGAIATSATVAGTELVHEGRGKGSLPPLASPARVASASGAQGSEVSPDIRSGTSEAARPAQPWSSSRSSTTAAAVGLPKATAHSAGGSAVLYPYHTQSMRAGFWKLGKKIGQGSFGTVHQGLNEDTGMAVAVKVLPRGQLGSGGGGGGGNAAHAAQVQELENEIALMQTLDHPNIVRYLGCEASPTCLYIFQEWVPCGSIADLLKAYGPLSSAVLQKYLKHVLLGLAYLHEQRVVHRDVKGGNVLVNEFGVAKLADFGCSKRLTLEGTLGEASHSSGIKGTPYFMAPEVIKNDRAGRPSDIWSLGGVAFQMATGDPPWKAMQFKTPMVLFYHVVNSAGPPPLDDERISPELANFLKRCFQLDPAARPSAAQLLQDPLLSDGSGGSAAGGGIVSNDGLVAHAPSAVSGPKLVEAKAKVAAAAAAAVVPAAEEGADPDKQVVSTPGRPLPPSNACLEDYRELSPPLPPPAASGAVLSPPQELSSVAASRRSVSSGASGDGCESVADGINIGEVGSEPDDDDDDDYDDEEEDARSLSGSKEEFLGTDEEIAGIFARAAALPRAPRSHDRSSSRSSSSRRNCSGEACNTPPRSNSSCRSVRSSNGNDYGGRVSASGTSISSSGSSGGDDGRGVGRGSSDRSQSGARGERSGNSREGRPPLWRRSQSPSTSSEMRDGNHQSHVGQRQHQQHQNHCTPEVPEEEEDEEENCSRVETGGSGICRDNRREARAGSRSSSGISQASRRGPEASPPTRFAGKGKLLSPSSATSSATGGRSTSASRPVAAPGSQSGKHGVHTGYGQQQLRKGESLQARPGTRREISPAPTSGRRTSPARGVVSTAPASAAVGIISGGGGGGGGVGARNSGDGRSRNRSASLRGGGSTPLQRRSGERKWGLNGYQPQAQQKHRAATAPTNTGGAPNEAIVSRSPCDSTGANNGTDSRSDHHRNDTANRNDASSKSPTRAHGAASPPASSCNGGAPEGNPSCSSSSSSSSSSSGDNKSAVGNSKQAEPSGPGRAQSSERRPLTSLRRFKERMQDPDRRSRQWAEGAK